MALTRRTMLATTVLAGAAATLGLRPFAAHAFRIEEDEVKERLYLAACAERNEHMRIAQDLIAQLEETEGHDRAVETVRAMDCPLCGCKLAPALDEADPS